MFAVIRHQFDIDISNRFNSVGEWRHYVWLFETELDAMKFAISLLDNPLLVANEHYLAHAIETLQTSRYWQVGRESVAVAQVINDLSINEEQDHEKSIH